MKRAMISVLGAVLLLGCDGGQGLLAQGAAAEAAGDFAGAATLYRTVCDKGSSRCPEAKRQVERLKIEEAGKRLDEGQYRKAKEAIDAALASSDPGVKRAAEVMSKLADLEKGLLWEEASTSANQDEALAAIEALAEAGVAASPRARGWLEKNRPRLLLERVRSACKADGKGSCVETGQELARRSPGSPEAVEAQKLVEGEQARILPLLKEAEALLKRQVFLQEGRVKAEHACDLPGGQQDLWCLRSNPDAHWNPESLEPAWKKKLGEIGDPAFVKPLEARWALVNREGVYDPEAGPRPAGKK